MANDAEDPTLNLSNALPVRKKNMYLFLLALGMIVALVLIVALSNARLNEDWTNIRLEDTFIWLFHFETDVLVKIYTAIYKSRIKKV